MGLNEVLCLGNCKFPVSLEWYIIKSSIIFCLFLWLTTSFYLSTWHAWLTPFPSISPPSFSCLPLSNNMAALLLLLLILLWLQTDVLSHHLQRNLIYLDSQVRTSKPRDWFVYVCLRYGTVILKKSLIYLQKYAVICWSWSVLSLLDHAFPLKYLYVPKCSNTHPLWLLANVSFVHLRQEHLKEWTEGRANK